MRRTYFVFFTHRLRHGAWLALLAIAVSARAADMAPAGRWFMGAEGGYIKQRFEAHYEYLNGNTPDRYVNHADGGECALLFGYAIAAHNRLRLDVLARAAANNAEWSLATVDTFSGSSRGGPSRLTFKIPFAADMLVRPRLMLSSRCSIFGEAGIRCGYLDLRKESAASTRYSIREWTPGFAAGGGLQFDVLPNLSLQAAYRYVILDARDTPSAYPDGTPLERVEIKSRSQSLSIGAVYTF